MKTLRGDVLPSVEAALEQTRYAYERGRYGYVEWAAAQSELAELRRAAVGEARLHDAGGVDVDADQAAGGVTVLCDRGHRELIAELRRLRQIECEIQRRGARR